MPWSVAPNLFKRILAKNMFITNTGICFKVRNNVFLTMRILGDMLSEMIVAVNTVPLFFESCY